MQIVIFFSILLSSMIPLSASLHIQNHMTVNRDLEQLQQVVELKAHAIKQQIDQIYGKIQNENDLGKKIELVEDLLIRQRSNIIGILQTTAFDLDQSKWTCEALGPTQKSGIETEEQQIKSKMNDLAGSIEKLLPGHPAYSIVAVTDSANTFVGSQKSALVSKGRDLPSNTIKNRKTTNFNFGYWALGRQTVDYLKKSLQNEGNSFVQFCPFFKPFADKHGTCVQCPASRPYWLLFDQTCVSCPKYDQAKRQCHDQTGNLVISGGFFTNFQTANNKILLLKGQKLTDFNNNYEQLPICPTDKPFFNSSSCIDCTAPLLFSLSDKSCRTCPSGQYHDPTTLTCLQEFYYSRTSSHSWSTTSKPVEDILESISIKKSNASYAECPPSQPFSTEVSCISCPKLTHFSYDALKCESCPTGTILNLNMHRCHVPENLNFQTNPVNSTNLIYNGQSEQEWLSRYYKNISTNSGVTDCPRKEPFFDGIACIQCPKSSPYFNLETLICQQCEGTTLYSAEKRECLSNESNRPVQTPTWQKMAAAVLA